MQFIDLSHRIEDGMTVGTFDTPPCLTHHKRLEVDKYNGFRLETSLHAGTHVDGPFHLTERPVMMADMPLSRFAGRGVLVDVRGKASVEISDLEQAGIGPGDAVLLWTGMDERWGQPAYYSDYPSIEEGTAHFFADRGIHMLGIDAYAPDRYPFPVHHALFARNIPIIENLTNLSALVGVPSFTVMAFPLKLAAEASLVRAVACVTSAP